MTNIANAQSVQERMTQKHPTCTDVFLNAMNIMPELYRHKYFDSLHTALTIWKTSCGNIPEVGCTVLLLSIEESTFDERRMDSSTIDLLVNYAYSFRHRNAPNTPVGERSFFTFISTWASLLPKENHLDNNEKFICRVFFGEIDNPVKEIRNNRLMYSSFANILHENETAQRSGFRTNYAFLGGIWIPIGDLSLLGNHPSFGFQFGARDNSNQLDLTLQFRFSKAANTYTIKRNNGYYDLNNYFGGYVGLDYTYYLVNKLNFDLGLLGGIGYDGFDITSENYNYDDLKPLSIGSFNANGGFKLNYYLTTSFYIGLQARYNFINYVNHGGSSMAGDAFSIDLIIGGNKKVNR
ncbi:MAG TPA: hypothetical protein VGQ53_21270 [Chitinophagaceae bacterium]|nr:hypothetical protein [Chitinophagaceae bacterium]